MSKGEEKLIKIFQQAKITFKTEIIFKDLHGIKNNKLRFDFGLFKDNKLFCLVEYDGKQHFEYIKHFHKTIFDFRRAQEWDRRKNSYCLARDIPLIRIPYWDYDKININNIFNNPNYRVKTKFHNDYLINGGK